MKTNNRQKYVISEQTQRNAKVSDHSICNCIAFQLMEVFNIEINYPLQTMISSSSTFVCALSGIVSGLIYRYNVCNVNKLLKVPKWVASIASKWLGRLVCSSPPAPPAVQMGATLEIQRQQQMELIEQQMLFSRFREFNANNNFNSTPNRRSNSLNGQTSAQVLQPSTSTNVEHVTALVEMGFDRQNVVRALQRSNNDMTIATNILLSES